MANFSATPLRIIYDEKAPLIDFIYSKGNPFERERMLTCRSTVVRILNQTENERKMKLIKQTKTFPIRSPDFPTFALQKEKTEQSAAIHGVNEIMRSRHKMLHAKFIEKYKNNPVRTTLPSSIKSGKIEPLKQVGETENGPRHASVFLRDINNFKTKTDNPQRLNRYLVLQ